MSDPKILILSLKIERNFFVISTLGMPNEITFHIILALLIFFRQVQFDDCLFGVSYPWNKDAWTFRQMSMVCFFEIASPE